MQEAELEAKYLVFGPLKDPVRLYEKAYKNYRDRFPEDPSVPFTANVCDVVRARASGSAASLIRLVTKIKNLHECSLVSVTNTFRNTPNPSEGSVVDWGKCWEMLVEFLFLHHY
jgi:hypothetical protein